MINQQYEVELNKYGDHTEEVKVLDDELKNTAKEEPVEQIYDYIDDLSIEDINIEDHYDFINNFPLQHSTSTLPYESSLSTDDLLENSDDYVSMNAVVIPDN